MIPDGFALWRPRRIGWRFALRQANWTLEILMNFCRRVVAVLFVLFLFGQTLPGAASRWIPPSRLSQSATAGDASAASQERLALPAPQPGLRAAAPQAVMAEGGS